MTAQETFIKTVAEIDYLLTVLKARNLDHYNKHPDKLNWASVGDAKHVEEMLKEVVNFVEN